MDYYLGLLNDMYTKISWGVFSVLVGLFVFAVSPFNDHLHVSGDFRNFVPYLGILGALLVASTLAARMGKWLKTFMIITGGSAIGWPIGLYLHDPLLLLIPDEPFTYILVFYICPVAFIAGVAGSIVFSIRQLVSHR